MKKIFNKKSGFTLIEIIVVLIILGVLAAIALPNLFSNINKSKGAEAIAALGPMKSITEACCQKNSGDCSACSSTTLGLQNNFTYQIGKADCTGLNSASGSTSGDATGYCLRALSALTNATASDYVQIKRTNASTIVCSGNGVFAGVC